MPRQILVAVASLALLVAALGASAATPSGIRGTVIKSPIAPVCREGVPCGDPAAGVVLVFVRGGVRVATATTTTAGTYRVVLRPGTYVLRSPPKPSFDILTPSTVRVRSRQFTVVQRRARHRHSLSA